MLKVYIHYFQNIVSYYSIFIIYLIRRSQLVSQIVLGSVLPATDKLFLEKGGMRYKEKHMKYDDLSRSCGSARLKVDLARFLSH